MGGCNGGAGGHCRRNQYCDCRSRRFFPDEDSPRTKETLLTASCCYETPCIALLCVYPSSSISISIQIQP